MDTPRNGASEDLFAEADALLAEARRLGARADAVLAGAGGRAARLALMDDAQGLLAGLRGVQAAVRATLHRSTASRAAAAAYGRVQTRR